MLDTPTRTAVLRLRAEGHGAKAIAKGLGISRNAVRRIMASGRAEPPAGERETAAGEHADLIRELYGKCEGNLVRVRELLEEAGIALAYSTLTSFCRQHGIGRKPKQPAGQYVFGPGEEMQHDTSPHEVVVGGKRRKLQCASLVLCYSRELYIQLYPTFNRFYCKVFLDEAIRYFGGLARWCMTDNTSVVVTSGSGKHAVFAPEMTAFGRRYGFEFRAHEIGDANRSARVERPFWFVERNFYPGREFADMADLNRQAIAWCDKAQVRFLRHIQAVPAELFQLEKPHLVPLPRILPEIRNLHLRIVDLEGNVHLHANRYAVPAELNGRGLVGRKVEVHETKDRVQIYENGKLAADHQRLPEFAHARAVLPDQRRRGVRRQREAPAELPGEAALRQAGGAIAELAGRLREKGASYPTRTMRRLHQMYLDYPTRDLEQAVAEALKYGLFDIERIERMVLRRIAGGFFRDPPAEEGAEHG